MGAVYFNNSNSFGNSPFYRIKPVPTLNQTIGLSGNTQRVIPLVRTGQDRQFRINSTTEIVLLSSSGTTTATISASSIVSGGFFSKLYLDSTDQCLYVMVCNSSATQYQLVKIDDLTGAVTNLGSSTSPASPINWGFGTSVKTDFGFLDKASPTTLRVIYDGYVHVISKTDGSIISEGTNLVLGPYSPRGCHYINADGDLGSDFSLGTESPDSLDSMKLPAVVGVSCGRPNVNVRVAAYNVFTTVAESTATGLIAVDDDKLMFLSTDTNLLHPCKLIYRSDWDRFLRTVADYHAGLI